MNNNISIKEYMVMQKKLKIYETMYGQISFDDFDFSHMDDSNTQKNDPIQDISKETNINPMAVKLEYTSLAFLISLSLALAVGRVSFFGL